MRRAVTATTDNARRPRLGLALGGGAALGLAHIGVLQVLGERGIKADVVAGTSIGAVVGAAYVFDRMAALEGVMTGVDWRLMLRHADLRIGRGGLLGGNRIMKLVRQHLGDVVFAEAPVPFAVVATDLIAGSEVVLQDGPVADAIRASISLPGIFTPVVKGDCLLVDGGMKNPVPTSVCLKLGAKRVIAVDVAGDYPGLFALKVVNGRVLDGGIVRVVTAAFGTVMKELARTRAALHPADVTIVPKIGHLRLYHFHRGQELIEAGRQAAIEAWPAIEACLMPDDRAAGAGSSPC